MRIAFIGGGTMAEAIISALLSQGIAAPDIIASDIDDARREALGQKYGISITGDNLEAAGDADLVVLAVKPFQFATVAEGLKGRLAPQQTIVSIMAGVTLPSLREGLGHAAVVRAMPNTPAQVGEGMCAWTATSEVSETGREQVRRILRATGREVYFEEEQYVDMATAVSGSGPGFLFLLMESFVDGAVHLGLKAETAREMVVQTFLGSARLTQTSERSLAELRRLVTTPGGTTAEGLRVLEEAGIREAIANALVAAYEKSKSLGSR